MIGKEKQEVYGNEKNGNETNGKGKRGITKNIIKRGDN